MDSQEGKTQEFTENSGFYIPIPTDVSLCRRRNSPNLSLYIDRNEITKPIVAKKPSLESNVSVSSPVGSLYNKVKSVRFPKIEDKEKIEKPSTPMGMVLKKVKSLPLTSTLERKIARKTSTEDSPSSRSKKISVDSTKSKMEEELQKVKDIVRDKQKSEKLISQMFPKEVVKQLSDGASVKPQSYDNVTIYFSDIVGYTDLVSEMDPMQVRSTLKLL